MVLDLPLALHRRAFCPPCRGLGVGSSLQAGLVLLGSLDPYSLGFRAHRPLSSSFFMVYIMFRTLQGNPTKGLLRGLWL